eukprot:1142152-Pelagomonas_calceolata.AAC.4
MQSSPAIPDVPDSEHAPLADRQKRVVSHLIKGRACALPQPLSSQPLRAVCMLQLIEALA